MEGRGEREAAGGGQPHKIQGLPVPVVSVCVYVCMLCVCKYVCECVCVCACVGS